MKIFLKIVSFPPLIAEPSPAIPIRITKEFSLSDPALPTALYTTQGADSIAVEQQPPWYHTIFTKLGINPTKRAETPFDEIHAALNSLQLLGLGYQGTTSLWDSLEKNHQAAVIKRLCMFLADYFPIKKRRSTELNFSEMQLSPQVEIYSGLIETINYLLDRYDRPHHIDSSLKLDILTSIGKSIASLISDTRKDHYSTSLNMFDDNRNPTDLYEKMKLPQCEGFLTTIITKTPLDTSAIPCIVMACAEFSSEKYNAAFIKFINDNLDKLTRHQSATVFQKLYHYIQNSGTNTHITQQFKPEARRAPAIALTQIFEKIATKLLEKPGAKKNKDWIDKDISLSPAVTVKISDIPAFVKQQMPYFRKKFSLDQELVTREISPPENIMVTTG